MVNEDLSKKEKMTEKEVPAPKDPNVYFVYTHVNKKESVRLYENFHKALELTKQARMVGVITRFYKCKSGSEEREMVSKFQDLGIEVNVMDESTGFTGGLKKLGSKLLSAVGL